MLTSVREYICNGEAGGSRQIYELSIMAQVSNGLSGLLRSQGVLLVLVLLIVLVIVGVMYPAVWSRRRTRRTAALDVLDRLLPWKR